VDVGKRAPAVTACRQVETGIAAGTRIERRGVLGGLGARRGCVAEAMEVRVGVGGAHGTQAYSDECEHGGHGEKETEHKDPSTMAIEGSDGAGRDRALPPIYLPPRLPLSSATGDKFTAWL